MESTIGVGLIGLGHIGAQQVQALQCVAGLKLVAACDQDACLRRVLPEGTRFFESMDGLLNDPAVEVAVIATPTATHEHLVRQAFAAGKHVIVEKPAASSLPGFDAIDELFACREGPHIYYALHAARAFEVAWFRDYYLRRCREKLGPITAFASHFYDPYVEDGRVAPHAVGLVDCWVDSGINALSVIGEFIDLSGMTPVASAMTRTAAADAGCPVQGLVQYQFGAVTADADAVTVPNRNRGIGIINTNWTLGRNEKRTWLSFGRSGHQVLLDHSRQSVREHDSRGCTVISKSWENGTPRLVNHYIGVFTHYLACRRRAEFDSKAVRRMHELLYWQ